MKITEARRMALGAQGFGGDRDGLVTARRVGRVIDRLGQFQMDSVNIVVRAHWLPLYSRLGPYDTNLLVHAASGHAPHRADRRLEVRVPPRDRRLYEYWGHAASLIDVSLYPALRFRRDHGHSWFKERLSDVFTARPGVVDDLLSIVAERGPVTARDLDQAEREGRGWWNWSETKTIMEWLFSTGDVAVVGRTATFERLFDLPARVIPPAMLAAPEVDQAEAHVTLVRRAAQALGVATARSLADYFRTSPAATRTAIATLRASGEVTEVAVDGWNEPAYAWAGAAARGVRTGALVSPFDSLAFDRRRLTQLFGIDYTIGLYTPAAQRTYGYYVYLFVLDDTIPARVDLKADRAAGVLRVQSAWLEASAEPARARVAAELAAELVRLAGWLGLAGVVSTDKGTLARTLAHALGECRTSPAQ